MVYIIEFQKGGCIHNGDIKLSKKKGRELQISRSGDRYCRKGWNSLLSTWSQGVLKLVMILAEFSLYHEEEIVSGRFDGFYFEDAPNSEH